MKYYHDVRWFHPFSILIRRCGQDMYDGRTYGLDLDLRTAITYHTYEYGRVFTFRILGFGFEYGLLEF